jgi:rfaE bifunctional protein kinase chain/domain
VDKQYKDKIKTLEELQQIIGPRPRKQSVIMCHGAFDIVHPGHIRHLMYAKDKADILIASVTGDDYITKANFRPFVPDSLRAMSLAALEMVDFVIIDLNPKPLQNLRVLQPDFFAKGYEYFDDGIHPKTQEEIEVLDSYGGEVLWTPGDVVYSSSRLIETEPPKIAADKLHILLDAEDVTIDDLRQALAELSGVNVHVVGDTIVDSYVYCNLIGGGTKTPTLSVKHDQQVDFVGGAAIVAKHIQAAGGKVRFSSVMGDDDLHQFVEQDLRDAGVELDVIADSSRPTTQKMAFIAGGYRLLKVDKLDNRPMSDRILADLATSIYNNNADVVLFSDFRHGIFSRHTISPLLEAIPETAIKVADSQVASRWGNILEFQGFDLITPNEREARFALGDQDSVIRPLAAELYRRAQCKFLLLKLGERGLLTFRSEESNRRHFNIDSFADHVVDAVGTGDALLAYAALCLASGKGEVIASVLGAMAAGVACETEGNTPVSPEQVLNKLNDVARRITY